MPWGTRRASRVAHHFSITITYIAYKYIPRSLQPCIFDYIDDHILRAATKRQCPYIHILYILVCTKHSIQLNTDKTELANTQLIGLGIQIKMHILTIAVTEKRKKDIVKHLETLATSTTVTAKYAQKCAGKCEDVAFIIYPLKVYLRHLRNAIPKYTDENQTVHVTLHIRNACTQWIRTLQYLNDRKITRVLNIPENTKDPCYTDGTQAILLKRRCYTPFLQEFSAIDLGPKHCCIQFYLKFK